MIIVEGKIERSRQHCESPQQEIQQKQQTNTAARKCAGEKDAVLHVQQQGDAPRERIYSLQQCSLISSLIGTAPLAATCRVSVSAIIPPSTLYLTNVIHHVRQWNLCEKRRTEFEPCFSFTHNE